MNVHRFLNVPSPEDCIPQGEEGKVNVGEDTVLPAVGERHLARRFVGQIFSMNTRTYGRTSACLRRPVLLNKMASG